MNKKIEIHNYEIHNRIVFSIYNMIELNDVDMNYIRNLNSEDIFEYIEIYNRCMNIFKDAIRPLHNKDMKLIRSSSLNSVKSIDIFTEERCNININNKK